MKQTIIIGIHELVTTVSRRSFLLLTIGLPLVSALIFVFLSSINQDARETISPLAGLAASPMSEPDRVMPNGYVDKSGIIKLIPPDVSPDSLVAYRDESTAKDALDQGSIKGYFIIPETYISLGEITYTRPDFNPLSGAAESGLLEWLLKINLLDGDSELAYRVVNPFDLDVTLLDPQTERDQDNPLTFFLPYGVTFLYYIIILMASSLLLNSLSKENENRVMELLLSSTTARQLITGKFVALGIVGLLQTVLWIGTAFVLLRLSGQRFALPDEFLLPPSFLFWGIVFFLLGYGLYASMMAGVGALVPNIRESSHITLIIIAPLLIPLLMISILVQDPSGAIAVALSIFPLTAPVAMMTRLSAVHVPLWQNLCSVMLLALSVVLIVRTAANAFHAQTLLTGKSMTLHGLYDWWKSH